ncbi:MAG: DNA gyrase inhibitor YacG [Pseudohongiellaceae bacterium]
MSSTDNKAPSPIRQTNCPTCQKIVPWRETSKYRPFCSRKCQLIDFGEWASEQHRIPGEEHLDDEDDIDRFQ